jgi:autotransporter-associated beta strand protein
MVVEFTRNDQLGALPDVNDYDRGHVVLNESVASNVSSNSTLRLAPGAGSVELARQFTVLGAPRIDVAGPTDTMTISRDIRGSGGLIKNGPGTLILNNALGNGYTGNTVVNGGTLLVTNTSFTATGAGNIILNDTGTFAGNAVVEGSITGNLGSTLSPGAAATNAGAGSIRTQNGLTLNADSNFKWTLNSEATDSPGVKFDVVTVDFGSIDIQAGANFVFEFTGTTAGPAANSFWAQGRTWNNIIGAVDLATIGAVNPFDIDNSTWSHFGAFSTRTSPTGVDLIWTPVPEPGALLTLLVSGSVVGGFRRFRRSTRSA